MIEQSKPDLDAQADKRVEAARAKFLAALEALESVHGKLAVEEATSAWPDGKGGSGSDT